MRKIGSARGAASCLLVGLTSEQLGMVKETLAAEAVLPDRSISFGEAVGNTKRQRPDVVVVGMTEAMDAALALAEALVKECPSATLVALSSERNAEAILAAMRVGYKEFVVLPEDAARLRKVVHDAAYSDDSDDEQGLVASIIGAKGGVGTTTLLAHLAADLAAIHRVLLIDLDFHMGDAASVLDVTPKDTIADVLPRADRIDERMLTGSIVVHRSKTHVLPQPSELEKLPEYTADDIYNVIRAAAKGYMFVLADCGSAVDTATALTLTVSDLIILVTTPDVISVRNAFRRLKQLEALGIELDRVRLVVNRNSKTAYISLADIENNLGIPVSVTITDDPKTVDQAINEGQLVREVNRKADVSRDISKLVALLTDDPEEDDDDDQAEESGGGWFGGLFGGKG